MRVFDLHAMHGGWFVGDFTPTCLPLSGCEVALKLYAKGEREPRHVHRVATELTLIVKGRVKMNGQEFKPYQIIELDPAESADFESLEETITVVVKAPSIPGDKYPVEESNHAKDRSGHL